MKKAEQIFISTTVICFAFTALGKLLSFWPLNAALVEHDPLFDVPFFVLLLFAAILELIVIAYCIFGKSADRKMLLICRCKRQFSAVSNEPLLDELRNSVQLRRSDF